MVHGSGFRIQGSGFRVQGPGFRVEGSRFRVQGSGFRVEPRRGCMHGARVGINEYLSHFIVERVGHKMKQLKTL